jgi:hypothetical protein
MSDLHPLLGEFAADRLGLLERHEASARLVGHYDFNNVYQYVINREETQLTWVQSAIAEGGVEPPKAASALPAPVAPRTGRKVQPGAFREIIEDDARFLEAFVGKWRPRVEALANARHRLMLNVVLGESQEHGRLFEQAAAGFEDVLGRRTAQAERVGGVLPTRWQE